jgi:hypothetical protein
LYESSSLHTTFSFRPPFGESRPSNGVESGRCAERGRKAFPDKLCGDAIRIAGDFLDEILIAELTGIG